MGAGGGWAGVGGWGPSAALSGISFLRGCSLGLWFLGTRLGTPTSYHFSQRQESIKSQENSRRQVLEFPQEFHSDSSLSHGWGQGPSGISSGTTMRAPPLSTYNQTHIVFSSISTSHRNRLTHSAVGGGLRRRVPKAGKEELDLRMGERFVAPELGWGLRCMDAVNSQLLAFCF